MSEIENPTPSLLGNGFDSFAFYGNQAIVTSRIIDDITAFFIKDPRIASVSFSDNLDTSDFRFVKSQAPPLNNLFLNKKLYDLVGPVVPSSNTAKNIHQWCAEASSRGLFHYSLVSSESRSSIELDSDQTQASIGDRSHDVSVVDSSARTLPLSMTVLVDCEWIRENQTGSQVATISLITELAAHKRISKVGLINWPQETPPYASHVFDLDNVQVVDHHDDFSSDIFWRPYQPSMDLNFLDLSSKSNRLVITFLDSISYNNESYFQSEADWKYYQDLFHISALVSDMVVCISEDVKIQLMGDISNIDANRIRVSELGTDHSEFQDDENKLYNEEVRNLKDKSFVLILGSKFKHKNVDFGIKVVSEARRRGSMLSLVIAGLETETDTNSKDGGNPNWVTNLEHVNSDTRNWLIRNASAVLYPTSAEGFGLVPFEAARFKTPIIATRFGPMMEFLHPTYSTESWGLDDYVSLLISLTGSDEAATTQINHINSIGEKLTWADSTEKLVNSFVAALQLPQIPARQVGGILSNRLNQEINKSAELQSNLASEAALNLSLRSSLSWRITAPIRSLHRLFTRR
jgi:glycosyltransferase involved in cell wall biosynthesis